MASGGFGYTVRINISGTLTAIAAILDGDVPEMEKVMKESTGHDAVGGWAQFTPTGKRKANAFTLTLGWSPAAATHAALITAFNSESTVNFNFSDPDGVETFAFAGHVTKLGRAYGQEDLMTCKVTIQPSGAVS
ncbi:MAG TPA: phage tail tube protein [Anaerolineaceae bacterium]|nr:phage tail tube protein [Anaerolineaceae bacterium]